MNLGIRDTNGVDLRERWRNGVLSFLGVMVPGFPNMFVVYGAHSPAAFSNAPMLIELQADWIRDLIGKFEKTGSRFLETRSEAAQAWRKKSWPSPMPLLYLKPSRGGQGQTSRASERRYSII